MADRGMDDEETVISTMEYFDSAHNMTLIIQRLQSETVITPKVTEGLVELKVGVLLPFDQKRSEWTKRLVMGGSTAIRLAMAEINKNELIPGAYVTLIEKDSYPHEGSINQAVLTDAIYAAMSLVRQGVIGIIGDISSSWTSLSASLSSSVGIPQCSFSAIATSLSDKTQFRSFFRTIPTDILYAEAMLSFVKSQGWDQMAVLYSDTDLGQQLSERLAIMAKERNISVQKAYQKFHIDNSTFDVENSTTQLIQEGHRVFFIAADVNTQVAVLAVAAQQGYINDKNVWLIVNVKDTDLAEGINLYNGIIGQRQQGIVPARPNVDPSEDPIGIAARLMPDTSLIPYNSTFRGGVFSVLPQSNLEGYPPYDTFVQKWSDLDVNIYPYAGKNVSNNEGMAYSCMMVLAEGFNNTIRNMQNYQQALAMLSSGQLGPSMDISTFNTSYKGPTGKLTIDQNGDPMVGNFRILNIQNGIGVDIATLHHDHIHFLSLPVYHDGTNKPPAGTTQKIMLNLGYASPPSIAILTVSAFGIIFAFITLIIVWVYRKHDVFRSSSSLFCTFELAGFTMIYVSVFAFVGHPSQPRCYVVPILFHLGFTLIVGNLVVKNYRIYRIFNNIFITSTGATDGKHLCVSAVLLFIDTILLITWFTFSTVELNRVSVGHDAYYTQCTFSGVGYRTSLSILIILSALLLAFAIFLAFKTRLVGRRYARYSENNQIGITIYNIVLSALVGFITFYVPTVDYYTRHFLTATLMVWACSFSLPVIFVPKLYQLLVPKPKSDGGKLSSRRRRPSLGLTGLFGGDDTPMRGNLYDTVNEMNASHTSQSEFLKSRSTLCTDSHDTSVHTSIPSITMTSPRPFPLSTGIPIEVHDGQIPIQRAFRWLSCMSAWEMSRVILIPSLAYFGYISERHRDGIMFSYQSTTVVSSQPGAYVLKVKCQGWSDILMQVASQDALEQWQARFHSTDTITDRLPALLLTPANEIPETPSLLEPSQSTILSAATPLHEVSDDTCSISNLHQTASTAQQWLEASTPAPNNGGDSDLDIDTMEIPPWSTVDFNKKYH